MKPLSTLLAIVFRTGAWAVFFISALLNADEPKSSPKLPISDEAVQKYLDDRGFAIRTLEQGGIDFATPRMAIYKAELHSAEKIKAQVEQADANAKVLLKGGAPSQVTGSQPLPKTN